MEETFRRAGNKGSNPAGFAKRERQQQEHRRGHQHKLDEIGDEDSPQSSERGVDNDDDPGHQDGRGQAHAQPFGDKEAHRNDLQALINDLQRDARPCEHLAQTNREATLEEFHRGADPSPMPSPGEQRAGYQAGRNTDGV